MFRYFILLVLILSFTPRLQAQKDYTALNYALIDVAASGDVDSLIQILKQDVNLDFRDANSGTALYYATQNNHLDIVKVLVYNGADMDFSLDNGFSPLMCACYNDFFDIAEYLARNGANTNDRDEYWATAMHYAVAVGDYYLVDMLLFYGAKPDLLTHEKISPLFVASLIGDTAIANLLLNKGANINQLNETDDSPLSMAIQENDTIMFDFLRTHGVDLKSMQKNNYTPVARALLNNNIYAFEQLKQNDSPQKYVHNNRFNPLNIVYSQGNRTKAKEMKKQAYSSGLLPYFNALQFQVSSSFNADDVFYSFGMGVRDVKYNLALQFNFGTRFTKKAVIFEQSDNTYWQLWEHRYILEIAAVEYFPVKLEMMNMELFAGLGTQFMLGKYDGVHQKINPSVVFVPQVGVKVDVNPLFFTLAYEYTAYHLNDISNHKLKVGIAYKLQFVAKPKKYELIWM